MPPLSPPPGACRCPAGAHVLPDQVSYTPRDPWIGDASRSCMRQKEGLRHYRCPGKWLPTTACPPLRLAGSGTDQGMHGNRQGGGCTSWQLRAPLSPACTRGQEGRAWGRRGRQVGRQRDQRSGWVQTPASLSLAASCCWGSVILAPRSGGSLGSSATQLIRRVQAGGEPTDGSPAAGGFRLKADPARCGSDRSLAEAGPASHYIIAF